VARARSVTRSIISAAALGVIVVASPAQAQQIEPPPYAEYRVDVIDGRGTTVQGGFGYTVAMGTYMRVAAIGGLGPQWRAGETLLAGRTDLIGRFVLDPFRQTPIALSLGGGVSVPYEQHEVTRPYLTAVIDVEGRSRRGITPAIQVGLGGGARVGLVFRTSVRQRR
jgi:hypothetical protein